MITINVQTDLEIAIGSQGEIIAIALEAEDEEALKQQLEVKLS